MDVCNGKMLPIICPKAADKFEIICWKKKNTQKKCDIEMVWCVSEWIFLSSVFFQMLKE